MVITVASVVSLLVYIVVVGLIFWLLWWALEKIAPPQPFLKIGEVILIVASVLFMLNLLLGFAGHPIVRLR